MGVCRRSASTAGCRSAFTPDLRGGIPQDRRDPRLLFARGPPHGAQGLLELAARRADLPRLLRRVAEAAEELAYSAHLAADVLELAEHGVGRIAVFLEVLPTGVGDAVELLGALGGHARVAHLLEPGKRRIDHAGTRAVEASRALFQCLDQLIAVAGPLSEQREQHQLQVPRGEPAARAKGPPAHAAAEPGAEDAEAAAVPVTHEVRRVCAAVRGIAKEMTMHINSFVVQQIYLTIYLIAVKGACRRRTFATSRGPKVHALGSRSPTCAGAYNFGFDATHPRPRCPHSQPEEPEPRSAARAADRGHRALGLGQVVPHLRHAVCRRPAPLR